MLDTGALVSIDRGDRKVFATLRIAERVGLELRSTGVVIAECWRDERGRQANLARLLKAIDVRPVDEQLGRQAGALLGKSDMSDATDATVVTVAASGDRILTSDPGDIRKLVAACGRSIQVVAC